MLREWVQSIVEAVIILLVLFVFLWPVSINGTSMQPSLENKDRAFISRFSAWTDSFGRGDIVVFDAEDFDENMVKRVIAVGGDYIEIADGNVYVNGEMVLEQMVEPTGYAKNAMRNAIDKEMENRMNTAERESSELRESNELYRKFIQKFGKQTEEMFAEFVRGAAKENEQ